MIPDIGNRIPREDLALRIIRSAEIDEVLDCVTDGELAELLLERVWQDLDILSTEASVVSEAIERLRKGVYVRRRSLWARKAFGWLVSASHRKEWKTELGIPGRGCARGEAPAVEPEIKNHFTEL